MGRISHLISLGLLISILSLTIVGTTQGIEITLQSVASPVPTPTFSPRANNTCCRLASSGILSSNALGTPLAPVPAGTSYEAIPYTGYALPDPQIAIGPSNLVVVTNNQWRIYDKSSPGNIIYQDTLDHWFANVVPTGTFIFDPRIIYDQWNGHFIMVAMGKKDSTQQSWWLVSASRQANATGNPSNWWTYIFDATLDGGTPTSNWADYPAVGIDGNALYLTANMFSFALNAPTGFQRAKIRFISLEELYTNSVSRWVDVINLTNPNGSGASFIQPATRYGTTGSMYLVNADASSNLVLWRIDNPLAPSPSVTRMVIPVSSFSIPPNAQQPNTSSLINTGGSNKILQAQYRNYGIWATQMTSYNWGSGPRANIRLYEIKPDGTGLWNAVEFGNSSLYLFYPSLTTDNDDNLVVSFSISGSSLFASIGYTGRLFVEPPNTIQAFVRLLKAGEAAYDKGNPSLWGDYSGTALDPAGSYRVWMFNEYAKTGNVWSTWVGTAAYTFKNFLPLILKN